MDGEKKSAVALRWLRIFAIGRKPKWTIVRLSVLILLTVVTYNFVLLPVRVSGISMEPTYHNGSINFINRLSYVRGREPQRGDVVGIKMNGVRELLLKRVVGLPGEAVSFRDGHVCINGERLDEPYLKFPAHWRMPPHVLGPEEYYYVGDNRSMSIENHTHGYQTKDQIVGKIVFGGNDSDQPGQSK